MNHGKVLPVLYDLAVTIGNEVSLAPLLRHFLQRMLFHSGFPAGFICLRPGTECGEEGGRQWVSPRIETAIGDYHLVEQTGSSLAWPASLICGDTPRYLDETALQAALPGMQGRYRGWLKLPIPAADPAALGPEGVVVLLTRDIPSEEASLTEVFRPALRHLGRAIVLCRSHDAHGRRLRAERDRIAEQRDLLATVFDSSHSGVIILDATGRIIDSNPAFHAMTGHVRQELRGRFALSLAGSRRQRRFFLHIWRALRERGHWQGEIETRHKEGGTTPNWLSLSQAMNEQGLVSHHVGILLDMSEQKEAQARIHQLVNYDALTALPNRQLLMERLAQAVRLSEADGRHVAVLLLDLDNFKVVNDTQGHAVGDQLLIAAARRIADEMGSRATVGRPGGDEFLVIVDELAIAEGDALRQAESFGRCLQQVMRRPFELGGTGFHVTTSIGVTLFRGGARIEDVLKQVDAAMYAAKDLGRDSLRFYEPVMQDNLTLRMEMEEGLRAAIHHGDQLHLHFQAQVDREGALLGAEALLRWQCPKRGPVSPGAFIPLAEDSGLILQIGEWVLREACVQLERWNENPQTRDLVLAVNVSVKQFSMPDFVEIVMRIVADYRFSPCRLKLELTESSLLVDLDGTVQKMLALQAIGIGFSMDDFGTGYSSLSYLKRLPIDQLKIDQSFVRDMVHDDSDATIVRTIIAMSEALGLRVVAEGVETEAQRDLLCFSGCHAFQGYLYGRPQPMSEFEAWWRARDGDGAPRALVAGAA